MANEVTRLYYNEERETSRCKFGCKTLLANGVTGS
jgi:hypothetical protein